MSHDNVIDSTQWLFDRAEALMTRRDPSAEGYWRRLLDEPNLDQHTRAEVLTQLGVCLYHRRAFEDAREIFESAKAQGASQAFVDYALGHCALASQDGMPLIHMMRAFVGARGTSDEAEYLRSLSVALREVGCHDAALTVLKGAAERAPNQPAILENLGIQYEKLERWVDAIAARDQLISLLKRNLPVQFSHEVILDTTEVAPTKAENDVRVITDQLRRAFMVVLPDDEFDKEDGALSLTSHPAGLHTLVNALASRSEPEPLLLCAQRLWALCRHDRLDQHFSVYVLAATIQWLAERQFWRVPTDGDGLKASYGVDPEQVQAAARFLLSRYDVSPLPMERLCGLMPSHFEELKGLTRAIMLDLSLDELKGPQKLI